MALFHLAKSFIDKLLSGDKKVGEVLKETIGEALNDQTKQQSTYDPVEQKIMQDGFVWQPRLWRRHIMAQMFKLLHGKRNLPISGENYDIFVAKRGATYPWRMLTDELRSQALLSIHDPEQFAERNRWFNRDVVLSMAHDLASQDNKTSAILLNNLATAVTPDALVAALQPMERVYLQGRKKSLAWLDAYKGAGAYFTMKNLILFHRCQVHLDDGRVLDRDASFQYLRELNTNPSVNGQQMFAVMLRLIQDNKFDWCG